MSEADPLYWFEMHGSDLSFSNAAVLRLAGPRLSAATLQNWANRGFVSPKIETKNVKGRRRYSAGQLLHVVLGHKLVDNFKIPPAAAIAAISMAKLDFNRQLFDAGIFNESAKTVSIDFSGVKNMWAVVEATPTELRGVKVVAIRRITDALQGSSPYAFVFPFGAEYLDLAARAMRVHQEMSKADDEDGD
jgi:hypothetical protein